MASVPIGTATVSCPAGTTTFGAETRPAGETAEGTTVSADCAEEIVRVSVVPAPSVTVETAGSRETTVGGAGVTLTWLDAEELFRLAVTCASPEKAPRRRSAR